MLTESEIAPLQLSNEMTRSYPSVVIASEEPVLLPFDRAQESGSVGSEVVPIKIDGFHEFLQSLVKTILVSKTYPVIHR